MTDEQAIAKLRQCHGLLQRIDHSGQGTYYQPSEAELTFLHGYEDVANAAAARPDGKGGSTRSAVAPA